MDNKIIFKTLIKNNHKLGGKDYIRGRISGIAFSMSGFLTEAYPNVILEEGTVISNYFTVKEYEDFIKIVNNLYPGLCIFKYKES